MMSTVAVRVTASVFNGKSESLVNFRRRLFESPDPERGAGGFGGPPPCPLPDSVLSGSDGPEFGRGGGGGTDGTPRCPLGTRGRGPSPRGVVIRLQYSSPAQIWA